MKEVEFCFVRIDYYGYLLLLWKEMLMNEKIIVWKKYIKFRVSMMLIYDFLVGKVIGYDFIKLRLGLVCKC